MVLLRFTQVRQLKPNQRSSAATGLSPGNIIHLCYLCVNQSYLYTENLCMYLFNQQMGDV